MFDFLKNLFPFLKTKVSDTELVLLKGFVDKELSKLKGNPKVIQVEIDVKRKVSQKVAEIAMEQLEKEYSTKLGKKVSLFPKNCF